MKKEQKIALALALIGGVAQINNKNKSRNTRSGFGIVDEIAEFNKEIAEFNKERVLNVLYDDMEYENGFNAYLNQKMSVALEYEFISYSGKLEDDNKNKIIIDFLEEDPEYYNSVLRRSGIYLNKIHMMDNLNYLFTKYITQQINRNHDDDYEELNLKIIVELISNDYHYDQDLYTQLRYTRYIEERVEVLKDYLKYGISESDEFIFPELFMYTLVEVLENLGYFDQNQE